MEKGDKHKKQIEGKTFWHSISASVLILIWTIYYYAMQYTGSFADLKDTIICGAAGLISVVFIIQRTVKFRFIKRGRANIMEKIKEILFPKKVAPIRLFGFRLFNIGGRLRWMGSFISRMYHKFKK